MTLVAREDGSLLIPKELAAEAGLGGGPIECEVAEEGGLRLRLAASRAEIARSLLGAGAKYLKPGESGVESFLKWREEDRRLDDEL